MCPRKVRARVKEHCSGEYKINPTIPGPPWGRHQTCRACLPHPSALHGSGRSHPGCITSMTQWTRRSVSRRDPLQVTAAMGQEGHTGVVTVLGGQSREGQSPQMTGREAPCMDFVPALASGLLLSAFTGSELRGRPLDSVPTSLNLTLMKDSNIPFCEVESHPQFLDAWTPESLGHCPPHLLCSLSAGHSRSC